MDYYEEYLKRKKKLATPSTNKPGEKKEIDFYDSYQKRKKEMNIPDLKPSQVAKKVVEESTPWWKKAGQTVVEKVKGWVAPNPELKKKREEEKTKQEAQNPFSPSFQKPLPKEVGIVPKNIFDEQINKTAGQSAQLTPYGVEVGQQMGQKFKESVPGKATKFVAKTILTTADQVNATADFFIDNVMHSQNLVGEEGSEKKELSDINKKWVRWYEQKRREGTLDTQKNQQFFEYLKKTDFLANRKEWEDAPLKEKFSKKMIGETLINLGPDVVGSLIPYMLNPIVGAVVSYGSTANDIKDMAIDYGVDPEKAESIAVISSIAITALDRMVPDEVFGKGGKQKFIKGFLPRLTKWLYTTGKEATTEVLQEGIQMATEATFRDDLGWEEAKTRAVMSGVGGGLGGSGMGVIDVYVRNVQSKSGQIPEDKKVVMTPDGARETVVNSDLEGTPAGDKIIKTADEAEKKGKMVEIDLSGENGESAITTEGNEIGVRVGNEDFQPNEEVEITEEGKEIIQSQPIKTGGDEVTKLGSCDKLGNCKNLANNYFNDATEMAQIVEKGESVPLDLVVKMADDNMRAKVIKNPNNYEAKQYKDILWIYDRKADVENFYQIRTQEQFDLFNKEVTQPIKTKGENLVSEIRKYKSAEEFIASVDIDNNPRKAYNLIYGEEENSSQPGGVQPVPQGTEMGGVVGEGTVANLRRNDQTLVSQKQNTTKLGEQINKNPDGFTFTLDGKPVSEGFAVSPYKERETTLTKVDKASLKDFISKNIDLLGQPGNYVGGWLNNDDGKFYLDVAVVDNNVDNAIKTAVFNDQIAIFDLNKGEEIKTTDFLKNKLKEKWNKENKPKVKTKKNIETKPKKETVVEKKEVKKNVSVPRSQLPIGTGKKKASRLEARIKGVMGKATPAQIEELGLSTYNEMNKKETVAKAAAFVKENPDLAIAVLEGKAEAPSGIMPEAIYVALTNINTNDMTLLTKLASLQATALGQRISILSEINKDSPIKILNDVYNLRAETYKRRNKVSVEEKIKAEVAKVAVKKPNRYDWTSFINSIQC